MDYVTVDDLCQRYACGSRVHEFINRFPSHRVKITKAFMIRERNKWPMDWCARCLLNRTNEGKWNKAIRPSYRRYNKKPTRANWQAHMKAQAVHFAKLYQAQMAGRKCSGPTFAQCQEMDPHYPENYIY